MRKKLIFVVLGILLLTGCGASSAEDAAVEYQITEQNGRAETTAMPYGMTPGEERTYDTESHPEIAQAPKESASAAFEGEPVQKNYFIFTRSNSISTDDDGTELLYEYMCDTEFTSLDPEQEEWVESILHMIRENYASNSSNLLQYARDSLDASDQESFYGFSNYQELGLARHDRKIVSLVVLSSVYSGGSHPNTVQTAWNLDMENRKILRLEDVIHPEQTLVLAELVRARVDETFGPLGEGALFEDYAETIAAAFAPGTMTPYWYLNEKGLVIFFNQYELGPYAAGIIKTEIPYEALEGILLEAYFPGEYSQIRGDMLLRGDWEGYRKIPVTVESDGERMLIGVEGEVWQVQLSEVSWLEGTVIGQKMLFSADCMNQNDVVELIVDYDDESRSFALEFIDGQGNTVIYYIHPDGLSAEP